MMQVQLLVVVSKQKVKPFWSDRKIAWYCYCYCKHFHNRQTSQKESTHWICHCCAVSESTYIVSAHHAMFPGLGWRVCLSNTHRFSSSQKGFRLALLLIRFLLLWGRYTLYGEADNTHTWTKEYMRFSHRKVVWKKQPRFAPSVQQANRQTTCLYSNNITNWWSKYTNSIAIACFLAFLLSLPSFG